MRRLRIALVVALMLGASAGWAYAIDGRLKPDPLFAPEPTADERGVGPYPPDMPPAARLRAQLLRERAACRMPKEGP